MLTFQRLDVYQRAIEFLALATEITESLPRGHSERADQLMRAAESVVRNIAEGAGRWTRPDSGKHYKIARVLGPDSEIDHATTMVMHPQTQSKVASKSTLPSLSTITSWSTTHSITI